MRVEAMRLSVEREGRDYLLMIDGEECGAFDTRAAALAARSTFEMAARADGLRVVVLRSTT